MRTISFPPRDRSYASAALRWRSSLVLRNHVTSFMRSPAKTPRCIHQPAACAQSPGVGACRSAQKPFGMLVLGPRAASRRWGASSVGVLRLRAARSAAGVELLLKRVFEIHQTIDRNDQPAKLDLRNS